MFRFDESNPHYLIVYTGADHPGPQDYRILADRWLAWLDHEDRFGVILVDEPHEHGEDDDEHRELEAEINRVINDFRRDYRERTMQRNVGFARVIPPEWVSLYFATPEAWDQAQEGVDRYAQYNWGIPGAGFTSLADAQAWIEAQFAREPVDNTAPVASSIPHSPRRVGLFYGSSTGVTEYIADEIMDAWAAHGMTPVEPINIGSLKDLSPLVDYDCLILGIPTWNIGQLQDDWDIMFDQLDSLDFRGKKAAIFGIGDQYGYPDNFLDAVGILGDKLRERGAELVGYWYDEHYEFAESRAFVDGKFMGLGIDDLNQSRLSGERITRWIAQIVREFALQPSATA